ncbi:uncharacterized protein PV09_05774 [Verruconis gallopava]|uniref:Zn(2)-C6 fungal-type domain-containing protein n=1 Tax=Verruconis gallopava TaxID=253628 RepID=A0A0D1YRB3_9PEZI|nr:uncharacterized protein PV09_05774 [Verruconis gallopava]KIW03132.1 hypothetical protein PV09_05774 [Verruconis gallopava]
MEQNSWQSDEPAAKRFKVYLACDICRKRKTRCDGTRPICTPCKAADRNCSYRKPADASVDFNILERLAEAERRLQELESRTQTSPLSARNIPTWSGDSAELSQFPDLHTAASCKILQCWPRLGVKFTLTEFEPLHYPKIGDQAESRLMQPFRGSEGLPSAGVLRDALSLFYSGLSDISALFEHLCFSTDIFSHDKLSRELEAFESGLNSLDPSLLSIECLLILTLAFTLKPEGDTADCYGFSHLLAAETCFREALRQSWKLAAKAEYRQTPILLLIAYIHVYVFSRPFHALGLLRHITPLLERRKGQFISNQVHTWTELHYILESDLLTEIDGILTTPKTSRRVLTANGQGHDRGSVDSFGQYPSPSADEGASTQSLIRHHLWLRAFQNRVLTKLYSISRAYCHPSEIGSDVAELSRELEIWYRSLPLDMQFSRNLSTSPSSSLRMNELSERYFACNFLLHRPVLYFVLHEDLEKASSPPGSLPSPGVQPWMVDASQTCIHSSLILLASRTIPRKHNNWCDNQLLLAAYLMTLQGLLNTKATEVFPECRNVDALLDSAEAAIESSPLIAEVDRMTLAIMRNVRHNVRPTSNHQVENLVA